MTNFEITIPAMKIVREKTRRKKVVSQGEETNFELFYGKEVITFLFHPFILMIEVNKVKGIFSIIIVRMRTCEGI